VLTGHGMARSRSAVVYVGLSVGACDTPGVQLVLNHSRVTQLGLARRWDGDGDSPRCTKKARTGAGQATYVAEIRYQYPPLRSGLITAAMSWGYGTSPSDEAGERTLVAKSSGRARHRGVVRILGRPGGGAMRGGGGSPGMGFNPVGSSFGAAALPIAAVFAVVDRRGPRNDLDCDRFVRTRFYPSAAGGGPSVDLMRWAPPQVVFLIRCGGRRAFLRPNPVVLDSHYGCGRD